MDSILDPALRAGREISESSEQPLKQRHGPTGRITERPITKVAQSAPIVFAVLVPTVNVILEQSEQ